MGLFLLHESFWIIAGQVVSVLGALLGIRLLTQVMAPDVFGELSLAMTLTTFLSQTLFAPVGQSTLRFFSSATEAHDLRSFMPALKLMMKWAIVVASLGVSLVCLIFAQIGKPGWTGLIIAAALFSILSGLSSTVDSIQNALRQRAVVACHGAVATWGRFLFAVVLVSVIGPYSELAMLGYCLASAGVLVSQVNFFKKKGKSIWYQKSFSPVSESHWRSMMISFAWPFAAWGVFGWAQMASDRWALELFVSTSDVGLYSVLYQIGYYPFLIVSGMIMQLVTPVIFQEAGNTSDPSRMIQSVKFIKTLTFLSILATMLVSLAAYFIHKNLFELLVAENYRSSSWLLPGMVLASGLFSSGQVASLFFHTNLMNERLLSPKIVSAIMAIVLNLSGAALFGLIGVVFANVIFSATYLIWVLRRVRMSCLEMGPLPNA